MPKFRIAKGKEKQEDNIKRPQQNVKFFSRKAYVKKSDIESFQSSRFKNMLIS